MKIFLKIALLLLATTTTRPTTIHCYQCEHFSGDGEQLWLTYWDGRGESDAGIGGNVHIRSRRQTHGKSLPYLNTACEVDESYIKLECTNNTRCLRQTNMMRHGTNGMAGTRILYGCISTIPRRHCVTKSYPRSAEVENKGEVCVCDEDYCNSDKFFDDLKAGGGVMKGWGWAWMGMVFCLVLFAG